MVSSMMFFSVDWKPSLDIRERNLNHGQISRRNNFSVKELLCILYVVCR